MTYETALLALILVSNLALIFILPIRKYLNNISVYFTWAIVGNVLWILGDLILLGAGDSDLAISGGILLLNVSLFAAYFLLMFVLTFPKNTPILPSLSVGWAVPVVVLALLITGQALNPINYVNTLTSPNLVTINNLHFIVYATTLLIYFGAVYVTLYKKWRKSHGLDKLQIKYLAYAAVLSTGLAAITNLVLPIFGNTQYLWLGPIFSAIYVVLIPATVSHYQVFDVKYALYQIVSYLSAVFLTGALAVMLASYFISIKPLNLLNSQGQVLVISIIAVICVALFLPIKKFFDALTKKIYSKNQVQTQKLLNEVNQKLVQAISPKDLLVDLSNYLQSQTFASRVGFYITLDSVENYETTGSKEIFKDKHWSTLKELLDKNRDPFIYTNATDLDVHKRSLLNNANIQLAIRMNANNQCVGYVLFGPKQNNNPYYLSDIQTLEIIADEIAITIQSIARFEEIAHFNVTLNQKINQATKELKVTNERLLSLDKAKDEFISMASHQLRTPLTSVKGYVSLVLDGDAGQINDTQKKFLTQALTSSQRMVFLIADLLNLSRLKTGTFVIERSDVNLLELIDTELNQLENTSVFQDINLTFKHPKTIPYISLDETKIRQVIMNFIDNALHYTPKGGEITINLKIVDSNLELTVTDTGIGIPKSAQHQLFTKFYRADNAKKIRPDGTGIGLYMAKKIILAHGGKIIFKSTEGKGSTFGFSFPIENL
jgi:signal transduction histidine kinase